MSGSRLLCEAGSEKNDVWEDDETRIPVPWVNNGSQVLAGFEVYPKLKRSVTVLSRQPGSNEPSVFEAVLGGNDVPGSGSGPPHRLGGSVSLG